MIRFPRYSVLLIVWTLVFWLAFLLMLPAQSHRFSNIHFYQLNTSHGLSDNYVQDLCTDRNGNLWVGTGDGLNMFNGKNVIKYFPREHPELNSNNVRQVVCDAQNRIWVMSGTGFLTLIDQKRQFHHVGLWNNGKRIPVRRMLQTKAKGIILFTTDAYYTLSPETKLHSQDSLSIEHFQSFTISGFEEIQKKSFRQVQPWMEDKYIFSQPDGYYIIDFAATEVSQKYPMENATFLAYWHKDQILMYESKSGKLQAVDPKTNTIIFPLDSVRDQYGEKIKGVFTNGHIFYPGLYLFTTQRNGIYIYDVYNNQLFNQEHNAADPTTLVNNTPYYITTDSTGWIFVGASPNGVSYFKSNAVIGQQTIFMDDRGNSYDGYINNIATIDNDNYYISTNEDLLHWNRSTNTTKFLINHLHDESPIDDAEVNFVLFDQEKKIWAAIPGQGLYVFTADHKMVQYINLGTPENSNVPVNSSRHMTLGLDGHIWNSTSAGVILIDPLTYIVSRPAEEKLKVLETLWINHVWWQDSMNVWVATTRGAYHYNYQTDELIHYHAENGLISNNVFTFNKDQNGNVYIGTEIGMDILLTNGRTKRLTSENGLLFGRVEALLLDKNNRMWIGNDVAIACFSIADSTIKVFDERYGLSVQGFRLNSYHQNSDDELIWGTERGIQYFHPDELYDQEIKLQTTIHRIETRDIVTELTRNENIELAPGNNYITFYFTTIDYSTHIRTYYQYKLDGVDEDWVTVFDQNSVRYNSIKPGTYVFHVRASNDGNVWVDAENEITVRIGTYFWDRTWFRFLVIGGLIFALYSLIATLTRKQKKRTEELETEVVINYFASRINTHQTTDELLWDVAKNCISKLKFEDCVIYLLDKEKNILVQKAAYGPKSDNDLMIHQPMDLPLGQGIVGSVAHTGKPELIADTTQDHRYIVDDMPRRSELAVPIILDQEVIGVIDSEHSRKNFFTQKHLGILNTISVLCANQIQRNQSEEEKQKTKIELLENKQKAAESRLQSLRLQMNPHFLFNALNSIQQMILANEEMVATRYLSRFSKLLRSILIHSDKETITLKEELDILKLYVELESVRFKEAFSYEIYCDEEIDTDEVKIPTLLIQPFVENAIWHGLMHKEGPRSLKIAFTEMDDYVQCIIEDNGIGRQKSAQIKMTSGSDKNHTGKGIQVSIERLNAMQKNGGASGSMMIKDLVDPAGAAVGTRVEINLPIQN